MANPPFDLQEHNETMRQLLMLNSQMDDEAEKKQAAQNKRKQERQTRERCRVDRDDAQKAAVEGWVARHLAF
jgi:hypothetical protein